MKCEYIEFYLSVAWSSFRVIKSASQTDADFGVVMGGSPLFWLHTLLQHVSPLERLPLRISKQF